MKQAKRMAEQQIAKLEGNSSDVTKEAVEHFQQEKENKAVELEALGIPCEANNIKTVKDLTRAETTIHKMRELKQEINAKTSQTVPQINAGCVPLSSQTPAKTQSEGYGSVPEMVQDVADRAALGDIQAKQIMQKLLHKSLKGVIDNRLILKPYEEPEKQTVESSEYGENLKLVVKPDVGNINDTFRRRQLKRRAAQGDQTAQAILDSHSY